MPTYEISGCGVCPFITKYRNSYECRFKMGYVVQNLKDYLPDSCKLIKEDIVLTLKKE